MWVFDIFKDYYFGGERQPPIKPEDYPEVKWALDILEPDPDYKRSFVVDYIDSLIITPTAFYSCCYLNKYHNRPSLASFHVHILVTTTAFFFSVWLRERRNYHYAKRDAFLRDYIIKHPEDFPEPHRPKYKEIFTDWLPRN